MNGPASEREALWKLILWHSEGDICATDGGRGEAVRIADALLAAGWRRDGGEDTPMPTRWYCSSCGEVEDCTTQYGEVVCKYKHIVATFFPALSAGRPIPTEEKNDA